jgi:hypothetical protein
MTQPGESARSRLWAAVRTPYPSHDYLRLVDLFFVALVMVGMLVFQHMVSNIDWTIPGMWICVATSMFITRRVIPSVHDGGSDAPRDAFGEESQ